MRRIARIILIAIASLAGLLLLAVVALYIPAVQRAAVGAVLERVNASGEMEITAGDVRLRPPLRVSVSDVLVRQRGDTMAAVGRAELSVAVMPLLRGRAALKGLDAYDIRFVMGTADSPLHIDATVDTLTVGRTESNLSFDDIDLRRARVAGARVRLAMLDTVKPETPDTAATRPLRLRAGELTLERVAYEMTMQNTVDSLGAYLPLLTVSDTRIDLSARTVDVRSLRADSLDAAFVSPAAAAAKTEQRTDTVPSAPWTVKAGSVDISARRALYVVAGAVPLPGLDPSYIEVTDVRIEVDSLYNRGSAVRVPLRLLKGRERCGLELRATGTFAMDSTGMVLEDMDIRTLRSDMQLSATVPLEASSPLPVDVSATAHIALGEVAEAMPALKPALGGIAPQQSLRVNMLVRGSADRVAIDRLDAMVPGALRLTADGTVRHPFEPEAISGDVALRGSLTDPTVPKAVLKAAAVDGTVTVPPFSVSGDVSFRPGVYAGSVAVTASGGRLAAKGGVRIRPEDWQATVDIKDFDVASWLPTAGVGSVTASVTGRGRRFDPLGRGASAELSADLVHVDYNGESLDDIRLTAQLADGAAHATLVSGNPNLDLDIDADVKMADGMYSWLIDGDIYNADLRALGLSESPLRLAAGLKGDGAMTATLSTLAAAVSLSGVECVVDDRTVRTDSVALTLEADTVMTARLRSGDLLLTAAAPYGMDSLLSHVGRIGPFVTAAVEARRLDVPELQRVLPQMDISLTAGRDNPAAAFVAPDRIYWRSIDARLTNDSLVTLTANALRLTIGTTVLDTLDVGISQHGKYLTYGAHLNERPGTWDRFAHVRLSGYVAEDKLSLFMRQQDISGKEGYRVGFNATAADSTVTVKLVPLKPVMDYKQWTVNRDNYITVNLATRMVDADLTLKGNGSSLRLYTIRDSVAGPEGQPGEQLALRLDSIHIGDWLSINPFAPPVKGDVSADLRLRITPDNMTGNGYVSLNDLTYGRDRVGDFDLDLDVANTPGGTLRADIGLWVDSAKVITATGSLNDTTGTPLKLDFEMIRFPLAVANPFLPKEYAQLTGTLSGSMDISGEPGRPLFDGHLAFDTATVRVGMLGSTYAISDAPLRVDSNIVTVDNLSLTGLNGSPLTLTGTVGLQDLTDPAMDLRIKARDWQLVKSNRARGGAEVYGNAFVDVDAAVRGNMDVMEVKADLALLGGTNVTYVVTTAASALASRSTGDMVTFVNFADSADVAVADSTMQRSLNMFVNADVTIQPGTTVNVDLSADGQNKVVVTPSGQLGFMMTPMNDGRLTGKINITSGFVRYTPPLMGQKKFEFKDNSFIAFNGDMLNPVLNIHAVDYVKANVTESGQNSRLVVFDVGLNVTNTLENLDVSFDLSTGDDMTVSNELQSMSPEQRANQAMNLLLYNTYTGPGTKANASLGSNPLFNFLEGQINSWAAQNIKGVDLTFGIDQYDSTRDGATSTATSYSYQVSKSLFNDRVKIIVGGNYSTDADPNENLEQNLVNDISIEYRLNRSGSMYVRIFRHTGYESILEGEVTSTGVGFVLRRKLTTLRNLFRFHNPTPAQP